MKNRPVPVITGSILFILTGCLGFILPSRRQKPNPL